MEVVVTTGAKICKALVKMSPSTNQHPVLKKINFCRAIVQIQKMDVLSCMVCNVCIEAEHTM